MSVMSVRTMHLHPKKSKNLGFSPIFWALGFWRKPDYLRILGMCYSNPIKEFKQILIFVSRKYPFEK